MRCRGLTLASDDGQLDGDEVERLKFEQSPSSASLLTSSNVTARLPSPREKVASYASVVKVNASSVALDDIDHSHVRQGERAARVVGSARLTFSRCAAACWSGGRAAGSGR